MIREGEGERGFWWRVAGDGLRVQTAPAERGPTEA
jgi:hypothetical protein